MLRLRGKISVSIPASDFSSMFLVGIESLHILRQARWVGDPQLSAHVGYNAWGDFGRIG